MKPVEQEDLDIPEELQYERDDTVAQAQAQFEQMLESASKRVRAAKALHTKQEQEEVNLPLFAAMAQWFMLQFADLLRFVQLGLMEAGGGGEEGSQLLPEDAAELLVLIEEFGIACCAGAALGPDASGLLMRIKDRIQELTLEIEEEEYEPLLGSTPSASAQVVER